MTKQLNKMLVTAENLTDTFYDDRLYIPVDLQGVKWVICVEDADSILGRADEFIFSMEMAINIAITSAENLMKQMAANGFSNNVKGIVPVSNFPFTNGMKHELNMALYN